MEGRRGRVAWRRGWRSIEVVRGRRGVEGHPRNARPGAGRRGEGRCSPYRVFAVLFIYYKCLFTVFIIRGAFTAGIRARVSCPLLYLFIIATVLFVCLFTVHGIMVHPQYPRVAPHLWPNSVMSSLCGFLTSQILMLLSTLPVAIRQSLYLHQSAVSTCVCVYVRVCVCMWGGRGGL